MEAIQKASFRREWRMKVGEIVKSDRLCEFNFYRQGYMYYTIWVADGTEKLNRFGVKETEYIFPVEVEDLGTATLNNTEKSVTLMRYIRKALEGDMFVKKGA